MSFVALFTRDDALADRVKRMCDQAHVDLRLRRGVDMHMWNTAAIVVMDVPMARRLRQRGVMPRRTPFTLLFATIGQAMRRDFMPTYRDLGIDYLLIGDVVLAPYLVPHQDEWLIRVPLACVRTFPT